MDNLNLQTPPDPIDELRSAHQQLAQQHKILEAQVSNNTRAIEKQRRKMARL